MSLALVNATVANLSPCRVESANIFVDDGRISAVSSREPNEDDTRVNCAGMLVIPGNACAHTHLYSALARGMPAPRHAPRNFPEILEQIWWRLDRALDEPSIRSSGLVGALDALHAGTTTLVDHHASPHYIDGSLDVLADALDAVGIRAVLCYEVTDRNGTSGRDAGLRENERFIKANQRPSVRGTIGAHASFTLEDDSLRRLAELANDLNAGVHIHVAEDVCDEDDSMRRCGLRTALRLDEAGLLRPKSIAAHGVHLDSAELELLARRSTWVVHNCRSNLNNGVGRAPVFNFGPRTAMGSDGIDQDMFAESRTAFFRAREDSLSAAAERFTAMLAAGGEMASGFFPAPVGKLEAGAVADLVILDYDPPTPLSENNLAWHWMFGLTAARVRDVMVDGKWVVRNGECCNVDEESIRSEARTQASGLWSRMAEL